MSAQKQQARNRSHSVRRARHAVAVLVAAMAAIGVAAPPANANLDLLGTSQNLLSGVVGGVAGAVQPVACPLTDSTPLEPVACRLDALHIRYATTYRRPDGTHLTRSFGALLGAPTLLDVTGDGVPDAVATTGLSGSLLDVLAGGTIGVRLQINRLTGGALPASVEAIVADPTHGTLPRANIAYGEDGLESTLPAKFDSTVTPARGARADGVGLRVANTITGAGSSVRLLASLFDGTPAARRDVAGGSLRYSPVPATSGGTVHLGDSFSGDLTSSAASTVDLTFAENQGASTRRFTGRIDQLPTRTQLAFEQPAADQRTLRFSSSAPVATITGAYVAGTTTESGGVDEIERDEATITGMPTELLVRQTGARRAAMTTQGTGPIGSIRFGLANGAPRYLETTDAYFRMLDQGGGRSLAGYVKGLTEASVDATRAITAETRFTGVATNPVRVLVDHDERHVDARFDDVPDHMIATIDPDGGRVSYDGHGDTIHAIDVEATSSAPFFGRATRLHGAIRDLPAEVGLRFAPEPKTAAFTASAPIGLIELAATDGETELPADDEDGVVYRDTAGAYRLGARIRGLKAASLTAVGGGYAVRTETAGGPFRAVYEDAGQTLTGRVAELPATADLGLDLDAGRVTYTGAGEIAEITARATKSTPFFGRATHIDARLERFPAAATLDFAPDGGAARFVASKPIGKIEVAATDGGDGGVPGTSAGVRYVDRDDAYEVAARILGLREVRFRGGDIYTVGALMDAGDFSLGYDDGDSVLDGLITQLPGDLQATIDPAGTFTFRAPTDIPGITATYSKRSGPLTGRIRRARATLSRVPGDLTVKVVAENGIDVTATPALPAIDLAVSSDQSFPDVPGAGAGATIDVTPHAQRAALRILGLEQVRIVKSHVHPVLGRQPLTIRVQTTQPQRFELSGSYDDENDTLAPGALSGFIDRVPGTVAVTVPDDRVHIESSEPIDHLRVWATNLPAGGLPNAKVDVHEVPPVLDIYTGAAPPAPAPGTALARQCPAEDEPCGPGEDECLPEEEVCEPEPDPDPPAPPPAPELFGIDTHGHGVGLITVNAWAGSFQPDLTQPRNEVRLDTRTKGHESIRARIAHLDEALYTKNASPTGPGGYPAFNGTDDWVVRFTRPEPILVGIRKEGLDGFVEIPRVEGRELPRKYGLRLGTSRVIEAVLTPDVTIPRVTVEMAVGSDAEGERDALIVGTLDNVPTDTRVCLARDGWPDCGAFMNDPIATGGSSNIISSPEIDFNLATNGPPVTDPGAMTVNARVCLGNIGSDAWVPQSCTSQQVAKRYIDVRGLRVRNFDLEYQGDLDTRKYCDNCAGDDALAAYVDTDGVLIDRLQYVKPGGKGVEFVKTGAPLQAQDLFAAVNYSFTKRAGFMHGPVGSMACPGNTDLYLIEREPVTGEVSRWGLPDVLGGDVDLWPAIRSVLPC